MLSGRCTYYLSGTSLLAYFPLCREKLVSCLLRITAVTVGWLG